MMYGSVDNLGLDLALSLFQSITGQKLGKWKLVHAVSSESDIPDKVQMQMELETFWKKKARS